MKSEAYVLINTKHGKVEDVCAKLQPLEIVELIFTLFGQYDIVIKLQGSSIEELENFVASNLRTDESIERTETIVVADVPS